MKKEILIIMSALHGGGAEKVLIDYLNNFDYTRYNVTLCLILNEGVYLKDIPEQVDVKYLYKKFSIFPYRFEHWCSKILGFNWFQQKRVNSIFKKHSFDTVVSYMEGIPLKFHNYFFKRATNHVTWIHLDLLNFHYSLSVFKNKKEEEGIYKKMSSIIFVSEDAKEQFNKLYNINVSKKVIYNIIDKQNIQNSINTKYIPDNKIIITAVGRLEIQKRFDRLIDAAKLLKDRNLLFQINIIGEGSLRSKLEKQIKDNEVEGFVSLKGFVKPPYNLINQSDILVATSEAEGFSLVVAEALCLGKAVVSTATAGPIELLDNGKYGIICEHDVKAIYLAIESLIMDRKKIEKYQKLALERSQFFEISKSMKFFENVIENE